MAPAPLKIVFKSIFTFILSLYANSNYPVKIVDDFVDFFTLFIRDIFLESLKGEIFEALKGQNVP